MTLKELNLTITYSLDVTDYEEWSKANPEKTIAEYLKPKLLKVYNMYDLVNRIKTELEVK